MDERAIFADKKRREKMGIVANREKREDSGGCQGEVREKSGRNVALPIFSLPPPERCEQGCSQRSQRSHRSQRSGEGG